MCLYIFLAQNFQYKFQNPAAGAAFAAKLFADFLPTLPANATPIAAHYGP